MEAEVGSGWQGRGARGGLGAAGCVVRHGSPKDSDPANHERLGAASMGWLPHPEVWFDTVRWVHRHSSPRTGGGGFDGVVAAFGGVWLDRLTRDAGWGLMVGCCRVPAGDAGMARRRRAGRGWLPGRGRLETGPYVGADAEGGGGVAQRSWSGASASRLGT